MLKITKNQWKIGQKIVTSKEVISSVYKMSSYDDEYEKSGRLIKYDKSKSLESQVFRGTDNHEILPIGTVLTFIAFQKGYSASYVFKSEKGVHYTAFLSEFKSFTELGDFPNLGLETIEYKLLMDGVDFKKKKFKSIGTVKSSLMSIMGYHQKFEKVAENYLDRCPENREGAEYWAQSIEILNRKDFESLELFEWTNGKIGKKVDFDFIGYYDEMIDLLSVSAQFGSAARETFKKVKDRKEFETILVYVPDDYRQPNAYYFDGIKESDEIKGVMKSSKIKGTLKSTKMGKTAIAFRTNSDVLKVVKQLPEDTFYVLSIEGVELEEKDENFVIQESRREKLENLLKLVI